VNQVPGRAAIARLLALAAVVGAAVGAVFHGFEELLHHAQHALWVDLIGEQPSALATIGLATAGGAALGLALWLLPGHGGPHPADHHGLLPASGGRTTVTLVAASLVVGFVGLAAGASLGPEGALMPGAVGLSVLAARVARAEGPAEQLLIASGLGALMAAMFHHPLAGAVVLLEVLPAFSAAPAIVVLLPTLTASAFAVITLQVFGAQPIISLPFDYPTFRPVHLAWAVLVGVVAGAAGLLIDRLVPLLRRLTVRLDARHVLVTTTLGGLVLGLLYVAGGVETRFTGFPELLFLMRDDPALGTVIVVLLVKTVATAWSLAAGYRGGRIFPAAFIGGAAGLALHGVFPSLPMVVAVSVGLSAAMVTAVGMPVTALLSSAALLPSRLLPLAVLGGVAAHAVHLLAEQLAPPAGGAAHSEPALDGQHG